MPLRLCLFAEAFAYFSHVVLQNPTYMVLSVNDAVCWPNADLFTSGLEWGGERQQSSSQTQKMIKDQKM